MHFDILTIFPKSIEPYFTESLFARAKKKGILTTQVHDLRSFSSERHKKVDDRPFGGGPGMVLQIGPIHKAIQGIKKQVSRSTRTRIILFSTRGKRFDAKTARRLAKYDQIILICGRYEGVDERVAAHIADEEISIGEFVLSGGELPALVLAESVSRFLPGFLGTHASLEEIKGSYPVYTRPASFPPGKRTRAWNVPHTLLSGNHRAVEAWRRIHGALRKK